MNILRTLRIILPICLSLSALNAMAANNESIIEGTLIKHGDSISVDVSSVLPRVSSVSDVNWSNNAHNLSFVADDKYLWFWDTQSGVAKIVATIPQEGLVKTVWSPDSKWLAYAQLVNGEQTVRVHSIAKNRSYRLLDSDGEVAAVSGRMFTKAFAKELVASLK